MFKTRLLSGIMLMIIALTTVIAGGQVLFTVLFAISLIGMSELYKVFGIEKKAPGIVGYIFAFGYYALIYMEGSGRESAGYGRISPGRKTYMVYAAFYGVFDLPDGSACIFLSEI